MAKIIGNLLKLMGLSHIGADINDGFAGSDGDLINGRFPLPYNTPGNAWVEEDGANLMRIVSDHASIQVGLPVSSVVNIDAETPDVDITVNGYFGEIVPDGVLYSNLYIYLRYIDSDNHLWVVYNHGSQFVRIRQKIGGVVINLSTVNFTFANNTVYTFRATMIGTTITAYLNGANYGSAQIVEPILLSPTKHGLAHSHGLVAGDVIVNRPYLDNFILQDLLSSTQRIFDSMSDGDGTLITAHAIAPYNIPAAVWLQAGANIASIVSNRATQATAAVYSGMLDSSLSDCIITANFNTGQGTGASDRIELSFRVAPGAWISDRWLVDINKSTNLLRIVEITGGVSTLQASVPANYIQNTDYTLTVVLLGTTITAYVSGGAVATVGCVSAVRQTATIHGFAVVAGGTVTNYAYMDDFQVVPL